MLSVIAPRRSLRDQGIRTFPLAIGSLSLGRRILCLKRTRLIFRPSSTAASLLRRIRCRGNFRQSSLQTCSSKVFGVSANQHCRQSEALTRAKLSTRVPYPYVLSMPAEVALPGSALAMSKMMRCESYSRAVMAPCRAGCSDPSGPSSTPDSKREQLTGLGGHLSERSRHALKTQAQ